MSVCATFTKSIIVFAAVSKNGRLFFIKTGVKVNGQYCWDVLLIQQMLDAIKCIVDDNSVFQQHRALMHLVCNTVQLLQCKTLNFLSSELWPGNSPELTPLTMTDGVTQQQ